MFARPLHTPSSLAAQNAVSTSYADADHWAASCTGQRTLRCRTAAHRAHHPSQADNLQGLHKRRLARTTNPASRDSHATAGPAASPQLQHTHHLTKLPVSAQSTRATDSAVLQADPSTQLAVSRSGGGSSPGTSIASATNPAASVLPDGYCTETAACSSSTVPSTSSSTKRGWSQPNHPSHSRPSTVPRDDDTSDTKTGGPGSSTAAAPAHGAGRETPASDSTAARAKHTSKCEASAHTPAAIRTTNAPDETGYAKPTYRRPSPAHPWTGYAPPNYRCPSLPRHLRCFPLHSSCFLRSHFWTTQDFEVPVTILPARAPPSQIHDHMSPAVTTPAHPTPLSDLVLAQQTHAGLLALLSSNQRAFQLDPGCLVKAFVKALQFDRLLVVENPSIAPYIPYQFLEAGTSPGTHHTPTHPHSHHTPLRQHAAAGASGGADAGGAAVGVGEDGTGSSSGRSDGGSSVGDGNSGKGERSGFGGVGQDGAAAGLHQGLAQDGRWAGERVKVQQQAEVGGQQGPAGVLQQGQPGVQQPALSGVRQEGLAGMRQQQQQHGGEFEQEEQHGRELEQEERQPHPAVRMGWPLLLRQQQRQKLHWPKQLQDWLQQQQEKEQEWLQQQQEEEQERLQQQQEQEQEAARKWQELLPVRRRLLALLCSLAASSVDRMDGMQAADILTILAYLPHRPPPHLLLPLVAPIRAHLPALRPIPLSMALWALARLSALAAPTAHLIKALPAAHATLSAFPPAALTRTLYAIAVLRPCLVPRLGHNTTVWLTAVAQHVRSRAPHTTPAHLTVSLWALTRLIPTHPACQNLLIKVAAPLTTRLLPPDSHTRPNSPNHLFDLFSGWGHPSFAPFGQRELLVLMYSYTSASAYHTRLWWAVQACLLAYPTPLDDATPDDLALWVWTQAKARYYCPALSAALAKQVVPRLAQLSPQGLSMVLWGQAVLGHRCEATLEAAVPLLRGWHGGVRQPALAATATYAPAAVESLAADWAGTASVVESGVFGRGADAFLRDDVRRQGVGRAGQAGDLGGFSAHDCCQILWSLAMLGALDEQLLARLAGRVAELDAAAQVAAVGVEVQGEGGRLGPQQHHPQQRHRRQQHQQRQQRHRGQQGSAQRGHLPGLQPHGASQSPGEREREGVSDIDLRQLYQAWLILAVADGAQQHQLQQHPHVQQQEQPPPRSSPTCPPPGAPAATPTTPQHKPAGHLPASHTDPPLPDPTLTSPQPLHPSPPAAPTPRPSRPAPHTAGPPPAASPINARPPPSSIPQPLFHRAAAAWHATLHPPPPPAPPATEPTLPLEITHALRTLELPVHTNLVSRDGQQLLQYVVQVSTAARRFVAVSTEGPGRFTRNSPHQALGGTLVRRQLLRRSAGMPVLFVRFDEWRQLGTPVKKAAWLQESLLLAAGLSGPAVFEGSSG